MKYFIISFFALALTSCTLSINITVNEDNTGTYAFEVIYSDSLREFMGGTKSISEELEGQLFSDETLEQLPEDFSVPELTETDSSTMMAFDFKSIEELNKLMIVMQEDPEFGQSIEAKGKNYLYTFNLEEENPGKEKEQTEFSELHKSIDFAFVFNFPNRTIKKVKKIEGYTISDDRSKLRLSLPMTELEEIQKFEIKMKVK